MMDKVTIERELKLIDGMIDVQLHHAAQCDGIANRTMADKQKGWDMERVALLRKMREALAAQLAEPVAEIIRNSAGQITMRHPDGAPFDVSQFVGRTLYAVPHAPAAVPLTEAELWDFNLWHTQLMQLADAYHWASSAGQEKPRDAIFKHGTFVGTHWRAKQFLAERQPAPAAVPLTDDQIDATIWKIVPLEVCMADHEWLYDFARAIERAHGIGAKP